MPKKFSLIIGIVIFVLVIGACYSQTLLTVNDDTKNTSTIKGEYISEIVYKGKFPIPVENFIKVSSGFGSRNPTAIVSANHHGIDLVGSTNSRIMSVKEGVVTYSGWQNGYGNCVEIKHINEDGKTFYTFYAHMQNNSLQVIVGQKVVLGQVVGLQGSSGNSTGDHLHFEVRLENKEQVNPAPYLFSEV